MVLNGVGSWGGKKKSQNKNLQAENRKRLKQVTACSAQVILQAATALEAFVVVTHLERPEASSG